MSPSKLKFLLLFLVLAMLQLPARGSTMLPVDLATNVDRAELIFTGTVASVESVPTADGSFAFTYVTFHVDETFKGAAPGPSITLRFAGGETATDVFEVTGGPTFSVGGKHLLFVEGNDRMGIPLSGGAYGKLDFVADAGTQQEILVDHAHRAVAGIAGTDWERVPLESAPENASAVVHEEGVKISIDRSAARRAHASAAAVLGQLRTLVRARRNTSSAFRQAPMVRSALKANVPGTFTYHAVPARTK